MSLELAQIVYSASSDFIKADSLNEWVGDNMLPLILFIPGFALWVFAATFHKKGFWPFISRVAMILGLIGMFIQTFGVLGHDNPVVLFLDSFSGVEY